MTRTRPILIFAILAAALSTAPASAQYFGRNKVAYKKLDFQILKTAHFDIYFYPAEREGVDIAARMAERWLVRYERLLQHTLRGRQPLVLYESHVDFEQTNAIQGELTEGTGGVTEPLKRRIILPLGGPLADTDHVIGHELVHAFQFDITTSKNSAPGQSGAERLPLWFIEGMAEYLSIGPVDANTAMWLRDAARSDKLPDVDQLDNPKYFPYRWGQAFWAYVGGRWGDEVIGDMLRAGGETGDYAIAIRRVLGMSVKEFSTDWKAAIKAHYTAASAATIPPEETGTPVITGRGLGGDLNVGPSISPDGQRIAFLSERGLFSIDLYLADAANGKVFRRLTSTATNPHYSSLQFIYSAGAWDRTGQHLAIAAIASGKPALALLNPDTGHTDREITLAGVDEAFNPTWSPDGRFICFTGMRGGLTDLYVVEVATSSVRALTHDAFADIQPAWSPDGRRIAFATDRFSSTLDTLSFGPYHIALIDAQSGAIEEVRTFNTGKAINPQWTSDGQSLYFIGDRDGIPNLYRVKLGGGEPQQITRVATGVSGITAQSPALSIASQAGTAAFSVYTDGKYNIHRLGADEASPLRDTAPVTNGAVLPPPDRKESQVADLLANPTLGLPEAETHEAEAYKPSLSLEAVGSPTIGVGVSRFGTSLGGGLSLYFSDLLGDHNLAANVQFNSGIGSNFDFANTAAQAIYMNQSRRWNWGVAGGQVPYLSGGFQQGFDVVGGQRALVDQTILFRQTERSAEGILAYPFSRAERVEFQGGITNVSFDQIIRSQAYSLNTGRLFSDETHTTSIGEPLTLATTTAAFVHDAANFGPTSPIQGGRYRVEATPTFGTIDFTSLLADYRRYVMPVPFYTVAARVLHYGRYGAGSDDQRLFPIYIGDPGLVRGYDINTFDSSDCTASLASSCPEIDRLAGNRMLIGNLELRFPLLRPFGASDRMYGPLPVEVALFADGGVAWNGGESPRIFGGERRGVASTGVALRVNLMGFAVGEFDFSRPFQRSNRGWIFQFNLTPGF